jgi:SAM-dependent methyltransferase
VLVESAGGRFALTAAGERLRSDVPGSLRNVALLYGEDFIWQAYGNMTYSVRTGLPAFRETHGQNFYEFMEQHPDEGRVFQNAMNDFSVAESKAILKAYDFADVGNVVDVGAGGGALLAAILQAHTEVLGFAFDMPSAEAGCRQAFDMAGVGERATFVGGDFFIKLPDGRDIYVLKSVLHNWDDEAALRILTVCREAIAPSGRLLVIERVIADDDRGCEAKLFDVNMLVVVGGRERSAVEHNALLTRAGFSPVRILPTMSPLTIIEAAPTPN